MKDSFGRLLVGAGVGITRDMLDRVAALQNVGVDVIALIVHMVIAKESLMH